MDALVSAGEDAAKRLLIPAIERDVRRLLTEQAEDHAIQVFATNLGGLLTQPPLTGRVVMGIDPAYRTGCKVAVVDPTGKVLVTTTIYPHEPRRDYANSLETLAELIERYGVSLITIGNGTASRETEALVAELTARPGAGPLHAGQRGRGQRVQRQPPGPRRAARHGRGDARGGLDRPPRPGPAGRAGQDRSPVDRGGHVPARRGSEAARRRAGRRGGEGRQPGRGGRQHRLGRAAALRGRDRPQAGGQHRRLPRRAWPLQAPPGLAEGGGPGSQGLPAGGGLPAHPRRQESAGRQRHPPGELPGGRGPARKKPG